MRSRSELGKPVVGDSGGEGYASDSNDVYKYKLAIKIWRIFRKPAKLRPPFVPLRHYRYRLAKPRFGKITSTKAITDKQSNKCKGKIY